MISSYPGRAKTLNAERDAAVSVLVLSDDWNGPWVQIDGDAEVLHMPEAPDGLVDYFRCISGEHPDWDEYRAAMRIQDKSLIRITPTRWGPIATGGSRPTWPPDSTPDQRQASRRKRLRVLAVRVVVVPPLVRRGLRVALGRVLPLLLAPERGDVEIAPGGA